MWCGQTKQSNIWARTRAFSLSLCYGRLMGKERLIIRQESLAPGLIYGVWVFIFSLFDHSVSGQNKKVSFTQGPHGLGYGKRKSSERITGCWTHRRYIGAFDFLFARTGLLLIRLA